jgi:5-methylcytosine-specific restriction protein B
VDQLLDTLNLLLPERLDKKRWRKLLIRYKLNQESQLDPLWPSLLAFLEQPEQASPILRKESRERIAKMLEFPNEENKTWSEYFHTALQEELSAYKPQWQPLLAAHAFFHRDLERVWNLDEWSSYRLQLQLQQVEEPQMSYERAKPALNQLFYGVPGTGKTHTALHRAVDLVEQAKAKPASGSFTERLLAYQAQGQIQLLTFHPAFSYEDFMEGIKPRLQGKQVVYEVCDGLLKKIAKAAEAQPSEHFVLILDEINRGNLTQILGEAITLLEEDKRSGGSNALPLLLPYSQAPFLLPPNLFIIATMNNSNRHTEPLDPALRRRFQMIELLPDGRLLGQLGKIDLGAMLGQLNQRLSQILGPNAVVGHSYFLGLERLEELNAVMQGQILPLLLEYFGGDVYALGQVLGTAFVEPLPQVGLLLPRQQFSTEAPRYRLRAFPRTEEDYLSLYV